MFLICCLGNGGAGHGGSGGHGSTHFDRPGWAYGDFERPSMYGSTAGTNGADGGGVVKLSAIEAASIDGKVTVSGSDSPKSKVGGSSAGSIWIQSKVFTGTGSLIANGGNGYRNGGGGAGGRIACFFTNNTYTGTFQAYGGRSDLFSGGAGTVYLASNDGAFRKLIVDNQNTDTRSGDNITDIERDGGRTWLTPTKGTKQLVLTQLDIRGSGQLASLRNDDASDSLEWDVGSITGDKTGLLHILANQRLVITGNDKKQTKSPDLPWGINIYPRGELTLSESFVVNGIKIITSGRLNGARNLSVANGGKVILR